MGLNSSSGAAQSKSATPSEEGFVIHGAEQHAALVQGIVYVDHQRAAFEYAQGALRDRAEFTVGDEDFRLTMRELEGERLAVETDIQSVQHGARHGHAEMRFINRRHIRRD